MKFSALIYKYTEIKRQRRNTFFVVNSYIFLSRFVTTRTKMKLFKKCYHIISQRRHYSFYVDFFHFYSVGFTR